MSYKAEAIRSEALKINLKLTNVTVEIAPVFLALCEGVKGYTGKEQQAEQLLLEYHHQYCDWGYVVREAWRYAFHNLPFYGSHPLNGRIVFLLSHIFLSALLDSPRREVRSLAADRLLQFWLKLCGEMGPEIAKPVPEDVVLEEMGRHPERIGGCHGGILRFYFDELARLPSDAFFHLMQSYQQPKQLASALLGLWRDDEPFRELRRFLDLLVERNGAFWLQREEPCQWLLRQWGFREGEDVQATVEAEVLEEIESRCRPLAHERFRETLRGLEEARGEPSHRSAVESLVDLPDFRDVVHLYQQLPRELQGFESSLEDSHLGLLMRLKIMETEGLEAIHEETLREINFELARWMRLQLDRENLENFLDKIFDVLKGCLRNYPVGALQCLRTIGMEVLKTDDRRLIQFFVRRTISVGFQTPQIRGVSEHWQIRMNPSHLLNVRIWLELIKKNPRKTRDLLSALIVNLSLGGIAVRDTDLFQKDVSYLLHAPIEPVYNLVKQLAKLFPVYFSQIGAEGQLRSVSTEVDELHKRQDVLIHFLRKQSHVEGNNLIVGFMEAIIGFWHTLDRGGLRPFMPPEVFEQVPDSGPYVDEIHSIFEHLFSHNRINHVEDLLELSDEEARILMEKGPQASEKEKERALLAIRFYQLLHEKYALSFKDMHLHLAHGARLGLPDPSYLMESLEGEDPYVKLDAILDYLMELKKIVLEPCELNIAENIYHKRHIAVDIPSMYGSYNERKFDALGLTFRLENLANVLFENIILSFNLSFITRATFFRIAKFIPLFMKALEIDGIMSNRLEMQAELFKKALEIRRFAHSQYVDVFRGFSEAIKEVIRTHYHAVHEENLTAIVHRMGPDHLSPRYQRENEQERASDRAQRISETFLRDLVARTFGLQYFDHFITSILTTLRNQKEVLSADKLDLLLSYDPEKTLSFIYDPSPLTYDIVHLGGKGYNLTKLHSLGVRVPAGFIITTEYFRCQKVVDDFAQSNQDFRSRVMEYVADLARRNGRCFGCAENALLLSVRSGSPVSMPGMMNSFLNVGINESIVEGLVAQVGEAWFAWDNYRRFLQSWGMSFGMQRDEFDEIMKRFKDRYGRRVKREFLPQEIRQVALAYKEALRAHGIDFSEDPREQLFTAIRKVIESWSSPQADTYRRIMGLSDQWGTAVTVQVMVYGNVDTNSGAGVMFSHDPWTSEDRIDPTGDFTRGNQGEDVVGGLVKTLPLSEKQRLSRGSEQEYSLESLFPRVYGRLSEVAHELVYKHKWSPQEIEFTFQGNREDGLYILQSRNMTARIKRRRPVFEDGPELRESCLGTGIGVSGGALGGLAAFDLESIEDLRRRFPGQAIIFIRSDTVPEDIREISVADGILTGKGGATSHAAIVAHRLEKTCVVGFSRMRVRESERSCSIDDHVIGTGDWLSIDGRSGEVYLGRHPTRLVDLEG